MTDLHDTVQFAMPIHRYEPQPLPEGAAILGFTSDPSLNWSVVYCGPCQDARCRQDPHRKLYIVPLTGWFHVEDPVGFGLRPAVMLSSGRVVDYLAVGDGFQFLAVLENTPDIMEAASALYSERFGTEERDVESAESLPN